LTQPTKNWKISTQTNPTHGSTQPMDNSGARCPPPNPVILPTPLPMLETHQRLVSVIYVSRPRRKLFPATRSYARRPWSRLRVVEPCELILCIIIIIINGRENKFTSAIIITCRPILTSRDLQTSRSLTSRAYPCVSRWLSSLSADDIESKMDYVIRQFHVHFMSCTYVHYVLGYLFRHKTF